MVIFVILYLKAVCSKLGMTLIIIVIGSSLIPRHPKSLVTLPFKTMMWKDIKKYLKYMPTFAISAVLLAICAFTLGLYRTYKDVDPLSYFMMTR